MATLLIGTAHVFIYLFIISKKELHKSEILFGRHIQCKLRNSFHKEA